MQRRAKTGFTLIELLIALVIGSIISTALIELLISQMQLSSTQNRTMLNQQNLREAMDYVVEEVSTCGAGTTEPFIDTATSSDLRFITDIDGDGNWDRIRYFVASNALQRTLQTSTNHGATWTTVSTDNLISGVTSAQFAYFASGNTAPANNLAITSVELQVTQNPNTQTTALNLGRVGTGRLIARATIRNRRMN